MQRRRLITPADIVPLGPRLNCIGVFNPGAAAFGDDRIALMTRIAVELQGDDSQEVLLPRWQSRQVTGESRYSAEIDVLDQRIVRDRISGTCRLTSVSYLQTVWIDAASDDLDKWTWHWGSSVVPTVPLEEYGLEDPRITRIDDTFYVTCVAVSSHGVCTCLISTQDFESFTRHGTIFCPENKDVVLFPERIEGDYFALHRPTMSVPFCRPEMWLARSPDLLHWGAHAPLAAGISPWELIKVGGGTPPLRLEDGWLTLYHGNSPSGRFGERVGSYDGGALLLDATNPARILARSREPLLQAAEPWEVEGFVPRVIFPTGLVRRGEWLFVFYGAADTSVGVIRISLREVRQNLEG